MSFEDNASAIDDSYGPVHFNPTGPASHSLGPSVYNGPRSGHWSVRDTVIGSAIDDGYPTVDQYPVSGYDDPGRVQPLNGDLILRLAKATEEQEKAKARAEEVKSGAHDDAAPEILYGKPQSSPPGFFVPKIDCRGIRIKGKNGKDEVVKTPELDAMPIKDDTQKQAQRHRETAKPHTQNAPAPPSVKPEKAASVASHASHQSKPGVRIVSKNGEEVFMYLPTFQLASNSVRHTATATKEQRTEERKTPSVQDDRADKAQRDSNAAKAAQKLREERSRQAQLDDQLAKDAKVAAEMMMSGALEPSKASSARKKTPLPSAKNLTRDKGIGNSEMFKVASRSSSVASSKISMPQSQAASATSMSQASKAILVASSRTSATAHQQAVSMKSPSPAMEKPPSKQLNAKRDPYMQATGWSKHNAVESKVSRHSTTVLSSQAKGATPVHPRHKSFAPSLAESQTRSSKGNTRPSHHYDPIHEAAHSSRSSAPNRTIFAGEGWISPHPLSVAPNEFEQSPEPAIQVPIHNDAGMQSGARTMTYEEWKKIQSSSAESRPRRNWSRSSSSAEAYRPGTWGIRGTRVAEEVRKGEKEGRSSGYHSPTVESVRSAGTYEHGFDGVRENEEKVWLPMPWDV